ncbi:hypothetical protein BELL_1704g00020 [Botrytis elliptica]|uniref:Uncharacterized protein n=1 Tax=Botrytis elliptica TaxID=278938 RepID=A0A4Z1HRR7_9HELO|nr:hypothetical protein BELL_1704g00020 [Botrytis elliptica]
MLSRPVERTGKEDQNIHKAVHVPQAINNFLNLRDEENKKNRISGGNLLDWHEIRMSPSRLNRLQELTAPWRKLAAVSLPDTFSGI